MDNPTNQFSPVEKKYHNITYVRPHNMEDCGDLRLKKTPEGLVLNFKIESESERKKFMEHGEITIKLYSHQLPPIAIFCGDAVDI